VHGLLSPHVTATSKATPEQPPLPSHASVTVHALPSEHALVVGVWLHPPDGLQASSVQGFPSLQSTPEPGLVAQPHLAQQRLDGLEVVRGAGHEDAA
jgi:hypothetical protein